MCDCKDGPVGNDHSLHHSALNVELPPLATDRQRADTGATRKGVGRDEAVSIVAFLAAADVDRVASNRRADTIVPLTLSGD